MKPDVVVILDRIESAEAEDSFTMHLHSNEPFKINDQQDVVAMNGDASCSIMLVAPDGLDVKQTDRFDVPPRERIKLTQHHLTATTPSKSSGTHFITVLRPRLPGGTMAEAVAVDAGPSSYRLTTSAGGKQIRVQIRLDAPVGEPDMRAAVDGAEVYPK